MSCFPSNACRQYRSEGFPCAWQAAWCFLLSSVTQQQKPAPLQPPSLFSLGDGGSCKEALALPANIHLQLLQYMWKAAEQIYYSGNARGNLFKCLSVTALLHTLHKAPKSELSVFYYFQCEKFHMEMDALVYEWSLISLLLNTQCSARSS